MTDRVKRRPGLLPPRRPVHDIELVNLDPGLEAGVEVRQDREGLIGRHDETELLKAIGVG
jgi:hypothetical protein